MHEDVRELRERYQRLQGQKDQILTEIEGFEKRIKLAERRSINCERALFIVQTVAQQTQMELEYKISELASLAMSAVYANPYEIKTEFIVRSGRTEVDIFFERDGKKRDPFLAAGGGPVDIAAFALRLALWNLSRPKTRNTITLDEPFRFVGKGSQKKSSEMLRVLSQKLNLQIIMTSHNEEIIGASHCAFELELIDKITQVIYSGVPIKKVDPLSPEDQQFNRLKFMIEQAAKKDNLKKGDKNGNRIRRRAPVKTGTIPTTRRRRTTPAN